MSNNLNLVSSNIVNKDDKQKINLNKIEVNFFNRDINIISDFNPNFILSSIYAFYINNKFIVNESINNFRLKGLNDTNHKDKFKNSLRNFLVFLKNFYKTFYNNYYHINILLLEFKTKKPELKELYAELISDTYENLIKEISKIKSTPFILSLIKIYLEALQKQKIFYRIYNDSFVNNELLTKIEKDAEAIEKRFWRRLYKMHKYFVKNILILITS